MFDLAWILEQEDPFRYQLLDRMNMDCRYYLKYGNRCAKFLWAGDEKLQIAYMKAIWNSFPDDKTPVWLTWEEIEAYEKAMLGEPCGDKQK